MAVESEFLVEFSSKTVASRRSPQWGQSGNFEYLVASASESMSSHSFSNSTLEKSHERSRERLFPMSRKTEVVRERNGWRKPKLRSKPYSALTLRLNSAFSLHHRMRYVKADWNDAFSFIASVESTNLLNNNTFHTTNSGMEKNF